MASSLCAISPLEAKGYLVKTANIFLDEYDILYTNYQKDPRFSVDKNSIFQIIEEEIIDLANMIDFMAFFEGIFVIIKK